MDYDILSIQSEAESLKCTASVISSIKRSSIEKHGLRRFENGRVFQSSKVGTTTLDQMMSESKKWAGSGLAYDYPLAQAVVEKKSDAKNYNCKIEEFKQAVSQLHEKFPQFVFNGSFNIEKKQKNLKASYGLDLSTTGTELSWYLVYQRKGSGNAIDGFFSGAGAYSDIQQIVNDDSVYLKAFDNIIDIKDGRYPIILGDGESTLRPYEKLTQSFLANKYHNGSALFSGRLNEKLFDERINLLDSGYDSAKNNLNFFDGEGTVRSNDLALIDQGRFSHLFYDLRYGSKHQSQSTGNGLRGYNQGVGLSPKNLYIKPGKSSWRSIIRNFDRCIFVNIAAGGDSNDMGEFSTPVQAAYIYEKGQVIGRAPQITIKTSVQKAFNEDLIDVSSDGLESNALGGMVISTMDVFRN